MNNREFDDLVTSFYRAASGIGTWPEALSKLCAGVSANAADIEAIDIPTRRLLSVHVATTFEASVVDRATLDYIREYNGINPRNGPLISAPVNQWTHCSDHFDDDFVAKDRFYQEYLLPYDMRHGSGLIVPLDERTVAIVGLHRSIRDGVLGEERRTELNRIGTHLREALLTHERVRSLAAKALAGHNLLSSFPYPMWLIDAERHVYYANAPAQREEETATRVNLRAGRLAMSTINADKKLTECLHGLQSAGHGASTTVDLRRDRASPPLWLHLVRMDPAQVLGVFGEQMQVMATLFDPTQISQLDPFALANLFELSPAEASIATLLAEGLAPEEITARHGTSINTVRTQLKSLYSKLGVSRQAEVVLLLRQGEALWSRAAR